MRPRAPRPTRILVGLAVCGSLALAACGSDSDSGGGNDVEAFCAALAESAESNIGLESEDEDLEQLRSIADAAPSEISDAMDTLVDIFEQLQAFDFENATEDQLAEFEELLPTFEGASAEVESYARDNCPDLPDDFFSTE